MEYFDIYDSNKVKTGRTEPRKEYFLKEGEFQLIVLALIERPDHKFLITQRSMDKKWAAGAWEVSGGGVAAGETSYEGICREVREEVGLDVTKAKGECIYTYSNVDLKRGDNYFVDIYHFVMDFEESDVVLQKEEALGFKIVPFSEITKLHDTDGFLHYERILQAFEAEGYEI